MKTKEEIKKIIEKKLKRVSKEKLDSIIELLNKKKISKLDYVSIPAKLKVEGKTYPIVMFRPRYLIDKDYWWSIQKVLECKK